MAERPSYIAEKEAKRAAIIQRRRKALGSSETEESKPVTPSGRLRLTDAQAGLLSTILTNARGQGLTFEQIAELLPDGLRGITAKQLEGYASSHGILTRKK